MPVPRGDASKAALSDDGASVTKKLTGINIEDLNLPKSIVTRLAKGVLPANTQIQSNAMIGVTRSATLFVNYIASQANERAATANRKTVSVNDVLLALEDSDFSMWRPRLEAELQKYNEKIGQRKEKVRSKETNGAPASKKIKRDQSSPSPNKENDSTQQKETDENGQSENENYRDTADADIEVDGFDEEEEEEETREDDFKEGEEILDDDEQVHLQVTDEALDNGEDSD